MPETSPHAPRRRARSDRRRARRITSDQNVRLVAREIDGYVLDVSRTGARIALFATGDLHGGTVVVSLQGDEVPHLAVVQWARTFPDGSIVGVEFLEELGTARAPADIETAPFDDEITEIRAVPVCAVEDVPGAPRTFEEGSVVVLSCVRLVA